MGLIDTIGCGVHRVVQIGVALEGLDTEDNAFYRGASHQEGVTNNRPLLQLALLGDLRKGKHLADVMQETDEVEPMVIWPLFTDTLSCLKVVDAVGKVVVRI